MVDFGYWQKVAQQDAIKEKEKHEHGQVVEEVLLQGDVDVHLRCHFRIVGWQQQLQHDPNAVTDQNVTTQLR